MNTGMGAGVQGLTAVRLNMSGVPFADNGLTKIPDEVTDEAALFQETSFPPVTGGFPAEIKPADTVAVIGAGPTWLNTPDA